MKTPSKKTLAMRDGSLETVGGTVGATVGGTVGGTIGSWIIC